MITFDNISENYRIENLIIPFMIQLKIGNGPKAFFKGRPRSWKTRVIILYITLGKGEEGRKSGVPGRSFFNIQIDPPGISYLYLEISTLKRNELFPITSMVIITWRFSNICLHWEPGGGRRGGGLGSAGAEKLRPTHSYFFICRALES